MHTASPRGRIWTLLSSFLNQYQQSTSARYRHQDLGTTWCLMPGFRTWGRPAGGGGGKSNRAWGTEGDGPGTPPHRAGYGVYLPKSSTLSLKTSLSMTEHEAEPHNSRRNEGYPSVQFQRLLQSLDIGMLESWGHGTLMPMIQALSAPALRATSYNPSPPMHLTPSTYLQQVSTFLFVLPLCHCFSLTTSLYASSFHSLGSGVTYGANLYS